MGSHKKEIKTDPVKFCHTGYFQKYRLKHNYFKNESNDGIGLENIMCINITYRETFFGRVIEQLYNYCEYFSQVQLSVKALFMYMCRLFVLRLAHPCYFDPIESL